MDIFKETLVVFVVTKTDFKPKTLPSFPLNKLFLCINLIKP